MSEGFYKHQDGELFYAPNAVCNKDYELLKEIHESYAYPVYGWYWFESREEACAALGYVEQAK